MNTRTPGNAQRSDVVVGDVIEVPPGTEWIGSARFRFRVRKISDWGATGDKVKLDGSPLLNKHSETIETGIPWSMLPDVILVRDGT